MDFGLPCWLRLLDLVGHLAEVADPAADLGVPVAGPAVVAGLLLPVEAAELDWPEVVAAVGVAVDSLSWLLAWLLLLVLVLWRLSVWLLWPLLWLRRRQLSLLLLLPVQLMLLAAVVLSLSLSVIGFGPCTS